MAPGETVSAVDAAWESGAALYENPGYVQIRGFGDLLSLHLTPTNFVGVAAGDDYLLGLQLDGSLSGVGNNDRGQLDFPPELMGIRLLAANGQHNLAVIGSGQVLGWGDNSYGQSTPPLGFANPKAIDCGRRHSLAIAPDDTVVAWGENGFGQCAVPESLTNVLAVAGGDAHSPCVDS
jgi:alpha-tubulin suppressor-like RCC1 family protein